MTRAQIEQLDAIPERTRISAEIIGRDGAITASVSGGIWLGRGPSRAMWWSVGFAADAVRTAMLNIRPGDRVLIEERRITVKR